MTVAEAIKKVARRQCVPERIVRGFFFDTIDELVQSIDSGQDVKIQGLGTFLWRVSKGRPGTGAYSGPIPDGWKLRFRPSKKLRVRRKNVGQ